MSLFNKYGNASIDDQNAVSFSCFSTYILVTESNLLTHAEM